MAGIKLNFFLLALGLAACARPHYRDGRVTDFANSPQSQSCSLPLTKLNLCLQMSWESRPNQESMGSFIVDVSDLEGHASTLPPQASLGVVLWMPSMGHGSSPVRVDPLSESRYRASRVFFIMPGEWEIHFQVHNSQGDLIDESVDPFRI